MLNIIYLNYYLERGLYFIGIIIWIIGFILKFRNRSMDNNEEK